MGKKILIIQRFFYNFREGFFDYLAERGTNFRLINSTRSLGRVTVHAEAKSKPYYKPVPMFTCGLDYVIFPFLFFHILLMNPVSIITEGGQNTVNNLQVLLYHLITGKKYIVWDLGKGYQEFPGSLARKIYMFFYKITLRQAAFIYTYNSSGKEYLKSLGLDSDKILVLNNTVDTRKIKRIRENLSAVVPAELTDADSKGYIFLIFVGALLPSKHIEDLKELMALLGDQYFLILVGDGEKSYREALFRLFEHTNCKFVGYKEIDEIAPYYRLASFAVLPGLGGLSINQAMAFGLPVISRIADGAEKDLIAENETGYIYSSLQEAAEFIRGRNKEEWKAMGRMSEDLLYAEHSLESMTEKFLSRVHAGHALKYKP